MTLMQNPVFKAAIVVAALPVLIAFAALFFDDGELGETIVFSALWVAAVFGAFFLWGLNPDRDPNAIPSVLISQPAPEFALEPIEERRKVARKALIDDLALHLARQNGFEAVEARDLRDEIAQVLPHHHEAALGPASARQRAL